MKKIGIVTLVDYQNYGNRIQAFAVQQIFKNIGFESELIRYKKEPYKELLFIRFKIIVKYILFFRRNLSKTSLINARIKNFKSHAEKYLIETDQFLDPLSLDKDLHNNYSFLSVGSDQIWGGFNYDIADFVFLKFAPKEKRLTFSPSFGSSTIKEKYKLIFSDGLKGFNNLSVREESGAEIIKNFTGKEATVICDPTMCLSKKEWLEFATNHKRKPKGKYIVTYFLGEQSTKVANLLATIPEDYEIINLNSLQAPKFYAITPSEWIDYINDAALFLTDSFHGVVFSLILQTPFTVYSRVGGESMQTRITNILEKFSMEDRFEININNSSLFKMDFLKTEKLIETEKSKAYAFLKKSMHI